MIIPFVCLAAFSQPDNGYAGLPQLKSPNPYRILSESVQIKIDRSSEPRITTLAVYRNQGPAAQATISFTDGSFDKHDYADGFTIVKFAGSSETVTWDNKPLLVTLGKNDAGECTLTAKVSLGKDATHTLRLTNIRAQLAHTGYAADERGFRFRLAGDHTIDLFTMAFQTGTAGLFGAPILTPSLHWEIGPEGASTRIELFTPNDTDTSIRFYRDSMRDLGKSG